MAINNVKVDENQQNPQTNPLNSNPPLSEVENQINSQTNTFNSNPPLRVPNPQVDEERVERGCFNSNAKSRSLVLGATRGTRSQRKTWIPALQAVEEENHQAMEEAIEVIPQASQLAKDEIEEVRKFKGKEKMYADKAFNDNGIFKVEVATALENGWLTDVSPVFSRVVLNLEQELWPGVFVKDVLEGVVGGHFNSVPRNGNNNPVQGGQGDSVVGIPLPDEDTKNEMEDMETMEVEQILTEWAIYEELKNAK